MKKCNACELIKPYNDFNKNKSTKDGFARECRDCHKKQNADWWSKNKGTLITKNREWKSKNREKVLASAKVWQRKQFDNNTNYAIAHGLRTRLNQAIKSEYKAGSAVRDLGCTIEEFRKHIESQFGEGMTWDNRGRWGDCWHIDHIKPLAKFDLTDKEQFMEACNFKNMQPMWCEENNAKSDWS